MTGQPRDDGKPTVLEYLEAEKAKSVGRAETIVKAAEHEHRNLTDEEREEIKYQTSQAHEFNAKIKVERDNRELMEGIAALSNQMVSDPETVVRGPARTVGQAFTQSDSYQAILGRGTTGQWSTGPVNMPDFGATAGVVTEGTGDNAEMFLPQRIPGILEPVEAPLGLTDLFGSGTISRGNSVLLVRETVTDNNADVVAEAGPKPASDIGFNTETATLDKIATVIKVSNEMLEDESAMRTYLDSRLATFVRQKREDTFVVQLLAQADSTGDATDIGGDNSFDAILAGSVEVVRNGGLQPDAVAMSMLSWATLLAIKDGNENYLSGGPFASTNQRLWGQYRIAITERLGDDEIVVGAFNQGGTVWRKAGGVTVEATNSNENDFLHNLVAIRAEERATLFLQRPAAFAVVSVGS